MNRVTKIIPVDPTISEIEWVLSHSDRVTRDQVITVWKAIVDNPKGYDGCNFQSEPEVKGNI